MNKFLDCSMGLTSVSLGHAYKPVLDAIKEELDKEQIFNVLPILKKKWLKLFFLLFHNTIG